MRKKDFLYLPVIIMFLISGCQQEIHFTSNPSGGTTLAEFTIDCNSPDLNGVYQAGVSLTSVNFVNIGVNASVTGTYSISTTAINGIVFAGSGVLVTGGQTITLTASGTPTASGNFSIPLSFGSSGCNFPLTVDPGSSIDWKFTAGSGSSAITYQGPTTDAVETSSGGLAALTVQGTTADGLSTFGINVSNTQGTIVTGGYSGTNNFGMFANFVFTDGGPTIYLAGPISASNLPVTITTYDTTNHLVGGTFNGTASNGQGSTILISNGTFKAHLP
jgi:hypothetical protein